MFRLFGHYVSRSTVISALFDGSAALLVFASGWALGLHSYGLRSPAEQFAYSVVLPSATLVGLMYALGAYAQGAGGRGTSRWLLAVLGGCLGVLLLQMGPVRAETGPISTLGLLSVAAVGFAASRAALRCNFAARKLCSRVLILGSGRKAERLRSILAAKGENRHELMFADVAAAASEAREVGLSGERRAALNDFSQLRELALGNQVREIVVALDDDRELPTEQLLDCRLAGIPVIEAAGFLERETRRIDLDQVFTSWLVFSPGFRRRRSADAVKRAFDVAVSAALLVVCLPLMVMTAVAICIDSRGPIFYRQTRVGLGGRSFELIKFRTMRVGAESDGVPRWAAQKDARVTRVGALLRRCRIDEVPQLLNVLRGEMSLIGPRPERPFFVADLSRTVPHYADRHRVRPGITGWAQVKYPYGASVEDAREKLCLDLYYVKNRSFFLDVVILLQSARVVLWGEGAR